MPANIDQHFIRNEVQTEIRPQSRGGGAEGDIPFPPAGVASMLVCSTEGVISWLEAPAAGLPKFDGGAATGLTWLDTQTAAEAGFLVFNTSGVVSALLAPNSGIPTLQPGGTLPSWSGSGATFPAMLISDNTGYIYFKNADSPGVMIGDGISIIWLSSVGEAGTVLMPEVVTDIPHWHS